MFLLNFPFSPVSFAMPNPGYHQKPRLPRRRDQSSESSGASYSDANPLPKWKLILLLLRIRNAIQNNTMNEQIKGVIGIVVRHAVGYAGGFLTSNGLATGDQLEMISGAITVGIVIAISYFTKKKANTL